ncbi:TetR/AcrR family transcriptional regulator [Candidatus Albibeggiatoa sp. nov. NOAA]|uniref:TetR/AcrR family transcriptional regulator n=1 Tax=Candidatus Albibeggiatoa sp. nov. NOAA TaxID=3162724 RepID=UPI0032F622E8|nr:TetR/AcrR family transcriptional regulator [Thiotrichaceae bacterium]
MLNKTEEIRLNILNCAEERFRHYGYRKTAMSEIAQDMNMSTANLYRYFDNKEDIAAACTERCMDKNLQCLRDVLKMPNITASERLEHFFIEQLRQLHDETHNHTKITEIVEFIATQRQELIFQKIKIIQSLIAEILSEGNRTGEFEVDDVLTTSEAVYACMTVFNVPLFMTVYPLETLEHMARNVVKLLLTGLHKR